MPYPAHPARQFLALLVVIDQHRDPQRAARQFDPSFFEMPEYQRRRPVGGRVRDLETYTFSVARELVPRRGDRPACRQLDRRFRSLGTLCIGMQQPMLRIGHDVAAVASTGIRMLIGDHAEVCGVGKALARPPIDSPPRRGRRIEFACSRTAHAAEVSHCAWRIWRDFDPAVRAIQAQPHIGTGDLGIKRDEVLRRFERSGD